MFYDNAQLAIDNHPEATHILTTGPDWVVNNRNPHLIGKFVAVKDNGNKYIVLHTVNAITRSVKYESDWIVVKELHHG